MKTLSIRNPGAYLVAFGVKDVENRSWKTNYRGELLIHSSGDFLDWINLKDLPPDFETRCMRVLDDNTPYESLDDDLRRYSDLITFLAGKLQIIGVDLENFQSELNSAVRKHGPPMLSQAIVGRCELVDVVKNSESVWSEPYKWHWIIKKAEVFKNPILGVRGRLRLWDLTLDH